ncbi:hypothetical protein [Actinomadura oligospora]|uniref:hypothetical protein n=1 Tax=Actinomadura oligospora TaxID=111804 RepID=UPI00047CAE0F|nr:hypothetical protein [Actinomadura oligospora]
MTEPRSRLVVPLMRAKVPCDVQLEFPLPPGEEPIREPFAADVYVTYALELPAEPGTVTLPGAGAGRRYEHVARRHCGELGIDPRDLARQASINLRDLRPELGMSWYPDARAVTVTLGSADAKDPSGRGGLEASLLLDEGFCDKLAQDVEGDLVVAAPARDVFVASGTGHADGIAKLRWAVDQVWAAERAADPAVPANWDVPAGSLLTRDLLVRRPTGWEPLPV